MKKILILSILLLPVSMFSQYFSGAAGFYNYAEEDPSKNYYGVLGGNFHLTLKDNNSTVIHHNNPLLYGNLNTYTIDLPEGETIFSIGPIPADDEVFIRADYQKDLQFMLINNQGKRVRIIKGVPDSGITISTSQLASGMYFLYILENKKRKIQSLPILINH